MRMIQSNLALILLPMAALLQPAMAGTCCQTCNDPFTDAPECWELLPGGGDTGALDPSGTFAECKAAGYFAFIGDFSWQACSENACSMTGNPPNGDCYYQDNSCALETDTVFRVTLEWCVNSGGVRFETFYGGLVCDTVENWQAMFPNYHSTGTCCQDCTLSNPECWTMLPDGGVCDSYGNPMGTYESCKEQGYFTFMEPDGTCKTTGNPPNGDCYLGDDDYDCSNDQDLTARVTLDWCEQNGGKSFLAFYMQPEQICDTLPGWRSMFPKYADAGGDPHFKTWSGKWFDYHGECDLVLLHVPNFMEDKALSVHVRTSIRYDYSFIEAAAIAIGDDVFEVTSWGHYKYQGIDNADLTGANLAYYPIEYAHKDEKKHVFVVHVGESQNITISTFKDLVNVKIGAGSYEHFVNSSGIMGSFQGKTLARDGVTLMTDMIEYGQEWQVREDEPQLFQANRPPQAPLEKCILPSEKAQASRRRLGEVPTVSEEAATLACSHYEGVLKDNCVFDVMAFGDLELAQAGAY